MLEAIFTASVDEIKVCGLTQWDRGQKIHVVCPDIKELFQVHFAFKGGKEALVVTASGTEFGIPDELLMQSHDLVAYVYVLGSDGSGETVKTIHLPVTPRAKPEDYTSDITPSQMEQLEAMLAEFYEDATATANEAKRIVEAKPNPNLLDNAYFGNPVDQRGGYVTWPEQDYYATASTASSLGKVGGYYKASYYSENFYTFVKDGTTYYVNAKYVLRGYAAKSGAYTIDRWRLTQSTQQALLIRNGGISLTEGAVYAEWFEHDIPDAQPITLSALINGQMISGSIVTDSSKGYTIVVYENLGNGFRLAFDATAKYFQIYNVRCSENDVIKAVKLELGTEQTLAHLENGEWVLNEIPNYAEELAKCQRTNVPLSKNGWSRHRAVAVATNYMVFAVPVPVEMRAKPALSGATSVMEIREVVGATVVDGFTFSVDGYGSGYVTILASKTAHGLTDAQLVIPGANAGTVFANSDL